MLTLLATVALAGRWDGHDPDVRAEAVVAAPADRVYEILTDLRRIQGITPDDCVGQWEYGTKTAGEGATAVVRYDIAAMHRRLALTLSRAEPDRLVDLEHAGSRGFVTRYTLEAVDGGTKVAVLTPLNPPPWPFRAYFFQTVKPEWERCQARTLEGLADALR